MTITLLSDLGTRDASVPVAKAVLLRHVPEAMIVDISHSVASYNLQQAAYLLLSAYRHFPRGTVHIVLVDVFAGTVPRMLVTEKDGFYFIAPDNGILPLTFGPGLEDTRLCVEFSKPYVFNDWLKVAGQVIEVIGKHGDTKSYPSWEMKESPHLMQPKVLPDGVECNILYIDRFDNVVLDITRNQFDELVGDRPFRIKLSRTLEISVISDNYSDAPKGAPLARFNDAGFLEIAVNHDKAASLLGLGAYNTGNLLYQTIKVTFSR